MVFRPFRLQAGWWSSTRVCSGVAPSWLFHTNTLYGTFGSVRTFAFKLCQTYTMQLCFQTWQHHVITASFPSANQPPSEVCQAAFLFPFPVNEPTRSWLEPRSLPTDPFEHPSAIGWCHYSRISNLIFTWHALWPFARPHFPRPSVFRTFWSIFLAAGLTAVVIGGFVVVCAGPLANHKLFKAGGALQLCGGKDFKKAVIFWLHQEQILLILCWNFPTNKIQMKSSLTKTNVCFSPIIEDNWLKFGLYVQPLLDSLGVISYSWV